MNGFNTQNLSLAKHKTLPMRKYNKYAPLNYIAFGKFGKK